MDLSPHRLRRTLKRRARRAGESLIFASGFADWLNGLETPWVIGRRPGFHEKLGLPGYHDLLTRWSAGDERSNMAGDGARFYALYQNVRQVVRDEVPGAFVELGVYKGNSAALLAALARAAGRHTYLFDTFEGFDERDLKGPDAEHAACEFSDASLAAVKQLVGEEAVTFVPGFFPDSLSQIDLPQQLAVAHIDCDLAAPIRAGLEVFYPRTSRGGLIAIHDYASGWWPGATETVDAFFADKPERPILIPDLAGSAFVRKF